MLISFDNNGETHFLNTAHVASFGIVGADFLVTMSNGTVFQLDGNARLDFLREIGPFKRPEVITEIIDRM